MNVKYVEISDLLWRLRFGLSLDGITRVTLLCLESVCADINTDIVKLLAFDPLFGNYRELDFAPQKPDRKDPKIVNVTDLTSQIASLRPALFWPKAMPNKGDLILYSGNWWWRLKAFRFLENMKAKSNAKLCVFIHDVIPLVHAEFVSPATANSFKNEMPAVCSAADLLITNSQSSRNDLLRWMTANTHTVPPIFVTPLPHEFAAGLDAPRNLIRKLLKLIGNALRRTGNAKWDKELSNRPFVLVVGTIEKRKNVDLVLKVWERVLHDKRDKAPLLVLVGKWGQGAAEIRSKLYGSETLKRGVVVINQASDELLITLYQRCLFTVYLSLYEGWGLPIGESLWFGKRVLASNTSAMPEAGEALVLYANPNDIDDITTKLMFLIKSPQATNLPPIKLACLRTRKQFGKSLMEILSLKTLT